MEKEKLRREQFPVTSNLIYLNHAAVGPLSKAAVRAMRHHADDQMEFGALHWREWDEQYRRLRASAARLIGADAREISILKNTSEGLSFVAAGLDWNEGENVVTTDLEFPSNFVPWKVLERRGIECRVLSSGGGSFTASDIERLLDRRTRIVSVSSVQFHNGFASDLIEIGELCHSRGILFCVDAIQSLGVLPIDVRKAKISFLAADGHKWLLGPEGAAIFFSSSEARERLRVQEWGWLNIRRGGRFLGCAPDPLEDGRRFEAGSLNTNGIYGLTASLDLLQEIGIGNIENEVVRLAGLLAASLEEIGFTLATPRPLRSGIVAVYPPAVESDAIRALTERGTGAGVRHHALTAIHRWLEEQGVVCAPREGMLRLSPHFYNSDEEIERVVELLRQLV